MFGAQLVSATIVVRDEGGHEYVVNIPHLTGYFCIREKDDFEFMPVPSVPGATVVNRVITSYHPEMEDAEALKGVDGVTFTVVAREEEND